MNEHVAKTIDEVVGRIGRLQELVKGLQELDPDPGTKGNGEGEQRTANSECRMSNRKKDQDRLSGLHGRTLQVLAPAAGLPQVFTREEFLAAGLKVGSLYRWLKAGFFEKSGVAGQYRKTPKFPRIEETKPSAAIDRPKKPQKRDERKETIGKSGSMAEIETRLEAALKQRDHARANGRSEMERIFQEDVDRLEGQLEALRS